MSDNDMFDPQIKLEQVILNQKSINESVSQSSENLQEQESFVRSLNNQRQSKSKKQINKLQQKTRLTASKTLKSNYLQKFFFNQSYIKTVASKFINKSYILQSKFKNHLLLIEEYLNDYSLKIYDQNKIKSVIPIINLNNKIIQIWELIKLLIYLYFMWMMPFKGVFDTDEGAYIYEIVLYYLIILDIGVQLNKEIILEGQLISDRSIIFIEYMKHNFIFEFLYLVLYTCITFQFLESQLTQLMNIMFFFFNLKKFQSSIQNYQESSIIINEKINLIELIITVLMLAHFMACIWFYVGIISQEYYIESWILKLNLQNENILSQYCYSFYWAATTMVTVGYGDITGQNQYEIICSTVLLFFSSGIFAFSMNSIGMILNNINQNGQLYRRNLLLINQYMTQNEVSNDLQVKVRNYLQFYFQSQLSNHQKDVNTIIDQLSQNLKVELISDVRQKTIQNNSFIQNYFSDYTKFQITQKSESINYTPLEQIYQQKSNDDHSLYVISKGSINLIDQNSGRIIQQFKQGDSFGELEFLTEQPRHLSAYSKGFSQILKVNRNDFIQIIKQNQKDFEQFHMLKDQILLNLKPPQQCAVCRENHTLFQCNKIFYKPDIEKVIKQDLFHTFQDRKNFIRGKQKNLFSLSDNQIIKETCEAYRYENDIESKSMTNISNSYLNSDLSNSDQQQQKTENAINAKSNPRTSISQIQLNINKQASESQFQQQDDIINQEIKKSNLRVSLLRPKSNNKIASQVNMKKKSRYLKTLIVNQQYGAQNFSDENNFIQLNLDQQHSYNSYFPFNNAKMVIKGLERFSRDNQNEKQVTMPSYYRFFQLKKMKQNENCY